MSQSFRFQKLLDCFTDRSYNEIYRFDSVGSRSSSSSSKSSGTFRYDISGLKYVLTTSSGWLVCELGKTYMEKKTL